MSEYPKTITIRLSLEIQVSDLESEEYFSKDLGDNVPSSKFLIDLFDIFEYEGSVEIERINEVTKNQAVKGLMKSQTNQS